MSLSLAQYKQVFADLRTGIKDTLLTPVASGSEILDRIITQAVYDEQGTGGRQFYQHLTRNSDAVDLWMFNVTRVQGLDGESQPTVHSIDKPVNILIQYYTDYQLGTTASNTEKDFDAKFERLD